MSLSGVLADFPVADVFQLIAQQRKTGVLEVERRARTLLVYFLEGQVLSARPSETRPDGSLAGYLLRAGALAEPALAEARKHQEETLEPLVPTLLKLDLVSRADLEQVAKLATGETIFELFLWDEGRFAFRAENVVAGPVDKPVGAEMVLLDALRMRDEWVTIQGWLPDLSVVVVPSVDVEAFRAKRASIESGSGVGGQDLERLFTLANGRLAARRVIDLSRLGTFQGARGLVALVRAGILRPETRESEEPEERGERAADRPPVLALALLAVSAALAVGLFVAKPKPAPGRPLPSDPVAELRESAATERLRAALEAHRWAQGSYPDSLDALSDAGALLAAVPVDRYSYVRSPDGYRLWRIRP
ncbi:MAG TPA: DUF4388 domain-containing protein [Myxococcota bacterium]|nr:DUF4388 domain-containing protein [Myxococcota bacterium]